MGDIMSIYKIYPEEVDDIEKIKELLKTSLEEPFKVADIKEEPIAFGLKILKVAIIFPDKVDGLLDKLEKTLKEIISSNFEEFIYFIHKLGLNIEHKDKTINFEHTSTTVLTLKTTCFKVDFNDNFVKISPLK